MQRAFSNCTHCHQSSREGGAYRHGERAINTAHCSLSSAMSHLSPSWLRNGNGCQITGGFCRYQVCFKEVFLPRALDGLVRFAGKTLAISYRLELGLCEKCVDRKPKVAGDGQS